MVRGEISMIEFSRSLREETYAICTIVQCVGGQAKEFKRREL